MFDGTELRSITAESLYELMSVIQQNVFVFNASIRDNVTMFRSFPQQEIDEAIGHARLNGLLSERGRTISVVKTAGDCPGVKNREFPLPGVC